MRAELIDDAARAEGLRDGWDRLAVAAGLPYATPAWQLGWWQAARPPGARLVILAASDGPGLAGVLGLYGQRGPGGLHRLRLLGASLAQGTAPLAAAGREVEVAGAFATALAALTDPRPATLEFEGTPDGARWAALMSDRWPGGRHPFAGPVRRVPEPWTSLAGDEDVDAWLARRSANFRQQLRRSRRRLEGRGAVLRRAETASDVEAVLPALLELHHARWRDRGGSEAVDDDTLAVLVEATRALAPTGRAHVEVVEIEGRVVSAHLFLAAGGRSTYWLGGFDDAYAAERPGLVALLDGVEHALLRGDARLNLGPGEEGYKQRFADGEDTLDWQRLLLPGPRRPLTRLQLAPRAAARVAADRLGPERERALRERLQALLPGR